MLSFFSTSRAPRLCLSALCIVSWLANPPLSAAEPDLIKLRAGRSLQLRAKADVYRTAVVDPAVCDIAQFAPRELSVIGRRAGQTQITFWFDNPSMPSLKYVIDVR